MTLRRLATFALGIAALAACPAPQPTSVVWYAVPACVGCDDAIDLAVQDMQVRDVRLLEAAGIPDASGGIEDLRRAFGVDFRDAVPRRVCRDSEGLVVVFQMDNHRCVGVEVLPDGGTLDMDQNLICDRWAEKSGCSDVAWKKRPH
jgi:hypothetical protein